MDLIAPQIPPHPHPTHPPTPPHPPLHSNSNELVHASHGDAVTTNTDLSTLWLVSGRPEVRSGQRVKEHITIHIHSYPREQTYIPIHDMTDAYLAKALRSSYNFNAANRSGKSSMPR